MFILAKITSWIPDKNIENLALKPPQTLSFCATSHVIFSIYVHLAHVLSPNNRFDKLSNTADSLS